MGKGLVKKKVLQLVLPLDLIEKIYKDAEEVELSLTAYLRILLRQPRPRLSIDGAHKEKVAS